MRELLLITFVLACPLMMLWMMRGHAHASHVGGRDDRADTSSETQSVAALRRQRDELDRLIEKREADEKTRL